MPVVGIPSLLRHLAGGQTTVAVEGKTVGEVIDNLDVLHPGVKERLCDGNLLRPSIAVVVDGQTSPLKLRQRLNPESQVYFVIALSGG